VRAVVQRVSRARVTAEGAIAGEIGRGLVVFLGVGGSDTPVDAEYLATKIAGLRIFEDESGKMNLAVGEVRGAVLAISQFTLYGDVRRGKRPSFDAAAPPEAARALYEHFVQQIREAGLVCETGRFQNHDASRTGKRWSGKHSAGFAEVVLTKQRQAILPSGPRFAPRRRTPVHRGCE